jgi:citrate synthase
MSNDKNQQETETREPELPGNPAPEVAHLTVGDKRLDLPVVTGTEQEKGIDITSLRSKTGAVTIDPGFGNTGSCLSDITFLDGERGILRYRGIPIEQLALDATYNEVAYLLMYGSLPPQRELDPFEAKIAEKATLPKGIERFFECFPKETHPMAMLASMTHAISGYYPNLMNPTPTRDEIDKIAITLLGQLPSLAAYGYRRHQGLPMIPPRPDLTGAANFLHMMFGAPGSNTDPDEVVVTALRRILILHADHEQNCSTSTVRLVGSSRANAFSAISSGISALWGPLHGGANQAVIEMLDNIQRDGGDFSKYIKMAKDKDSGFRMMGFGHRVYKNFDPRAKILKASCDEVLGKLGIEDPLLDLAKQLEEAALKDDYFVSRKLYPNVDFYSGIILRAIGIPTEQFTVIFVLGRLAGWLAHWKELLESPGFRIGRPRQIYTGSTERRFVRVAQRS